MHATFIFPFEKIARTLFSKTITTNKHLYFTFKCFISINDRYLDKSKY